MTTTLWILQGVLAFVFLMAGAMKLMKSPAELADMGMEFARDMSASSIKTIGVLQMMAAIGLILPIALNILPMLTGLAAIGIVLMMIGAVVVHVKRGEYPNILVNLMLGGAAAYVAMAHLS